MGTRHVLLVRHGQYDVDSGGSLTELGREQAAVTGKWIAQNLGALRVSAIYSSTLPRAKETADIIAPNVTRRAVKRAALLREGMYSKVKGYDVPASEREEDRARADLAWARFFKTTRADRFEILVCHGNLIRYLVCHALEVPGARWTRMNSNHCALTRVLVRDTGAVRVVSYNETAHLPSRLIT
ncbi:MAG: histidine phosphatase family protein [Labilithrix sp.]|nr:histidine phosphatase family protein [Labilithrix sp.]MCW5818187.1 histidine phosphatase family protein [Labilithrix sp.]